MYFKNKQVLVAGGTGLVGIPLVQLLIEQGAKVRIASRDDKSRAHPDAEFFQIDLTEDQNCRLVCKGMEYVFNLLCVKGPPGTEKKYPLKIFETMMKLNINLASAAFRAGVGGYLYTSSVGVYHPAEILREDDVWQTQPSKNDWFGGHVKRAGELQIEAYRIEHGWNTAIVRPSNIYGPYDNFDPDNAMFMPYIIGQFSEGISPIITSGDGSQVRDYIHSYDAARGLILAAENSAGSLNLCSGRETTNREVIEILQRNTDFKPVIIYDTSRPSGDRRRVLDVSRLKALGFEPKISLEEGIIQTMRWYKENKSKDELRYNIFQSKTR